MFRNPSYDELDIQTVEVGKADFADTIDLLASSMEDTDVPLLSAVKAMYDWSLLIDVLKGQKQFPMPRCANTNSINRILRHLST